MKEKELRLAVVFFGGVSLAIYQHGINREILNLVRASKVHHGRRPFTDGAQARGRFHASYPDEPQRSTGDVYLGFLQALGKDLALRVIVDVVTGSSAGGINGVALATALAHDRSLAPVTTLWLRDADMLNLLAPEARARLWSKWYFWPFVRPLLARLDREGLLPGKVDAEIEERVSVFLRSRWFSPPLDGRRLSTLLLDGLEAMRQTGRTGESLLPPGARLDLLVTATDFRGLERSIFIHDPPVVYEREHRHLLRFGLDHRRTGHLLSDFDLDNFPSLAFAGRASASYPGAFPPLQLREMDDILAARHLPWPARTRFLERNFRHYLERGDDPGEAVLVDGSVLDNKPIMACVEAVRTHGAFREVDRRLVYIDPHSRGGRAGPRPGHGHGPGGGIPGFFATLRGALSDLPRHDPVFNELAVLSRHNTQARRLKAAIVNARAQIAQMIEQATGGRHRGDFTTDDLRHWRLSSTRMLSGTAIVYDAWMRSLVFEALDFVVRTICSACRYVADSPQAHAVQEAIEDWGRQQGVIADSYSMPERVYTNVQLPPFAKVVLDFGLVYKKRRLNFVVHEINELYPGVADERPCVVDSEALDLLKIRIHKCIDELSAYDDLGFLSRQAVEHCRDLFGEQDGARDGEPNGEGGAAPVLLRGEPLGREELERLSRLIDRLAQESDLARTADDSDAVLASPLVLGMDGSCRNAIVAGYIGYFYWDIILRPTVSALSLDAGPIEEILVDRIGPEDAVALAPEGRRNVLLGGSFAGFGGFLGRSIRENDYLWGRLHAVERLFDILLGTVPFHLREGIDLDALKKQAFEAVLDEEAERLESVAGLIGTLRAELGQLGKGGG